MKTSQLGLLLNPSFHVIFSLLAKRICILLLQALHVHNLPAAEVHLYIHEEHTCHTLLPGPWKWGLILEYLRMDVNRTP